MASSRFIAVPRSRRRSAHAAERVVQLPVQAIQLVVHLPGAGFGRELRVALAHHGRLGRRERLIPAGGGAGRHGRRRRRAERRRLRGPGDDHRIPEDVGVDLHEQRILLGDAPAADDALHRHAERLQALDDGARPERRRLDERAVDVGAGRMERLAEDQAGQARVHEDRAIAVVPVERQQARLPRPEPRRARGQLLVQRGVAFADALDPPRQQVADGRLARFDAEVTRHDRAVDDAADARDVLDAAGDRRHRAVARRGADDLDERARAGACADRRRSARRRRPWRWRSPRAGPGPTPTPRTIGRPAGRRDTRGRTGGRAGRRVSDRAARGTPSTAARPTCPSTWPCGRRRTPSAGRRGDR